MHSEPADANLRKVWSIFSKRLELKLSFVLDQSVFRIKTFSIKDEFYKKNILKFIITVHKIKYN